jgi:hypothetical protein
MDRRPRRGQLGWRAQLWRRYLCRVSRQHSAPGHTTRRIYSSTSSIFSNAAPVIVRTTGSRLVKHFIPEMLTGTRRQLVGDIDPAGYRVRTGPSMTQRTRSRC